MKIGFELAHRHIGDPDTMAVEAAGLLDENMLADRAAAIRPDRALFQDTGILSDHGTVYLTAADASGMMVSMIQSNFTGFISYG